MEVVEAVMKKKYYCSVFRYIYLAVLEPESENDVSHEAVYLQSRAVPLALGLVDSVELWEGSDLHWLHHVWSEGLRRRGGQNKHTLTKLTQKYYCTEGKCLNNSCKFFTEDVLNLRNLCEVWVSWADLSSGSFVRMVERM